jgi:microcystin-dependent protein
VTSNRSRANRSVGNKLNNLNSRVSKNEKGTNNPHLSPDAIEGEHLKSASISEGKLADRAVTENKIARGAVGTEHLGIINTVTADFGLTLKPGPDGGFIVIDGPEYVAPDVGSGELFALGFNELNQVVVSSSGIGGGDGVAAMPAGSIQPWPTRFAPEGWLVCDGSAVSRTTYSDLFETLVGQVSAGTFSGGSYPFEFSTAGTRDLYQFSTGDLVFFTTTGTLPPELSPNTPYYVYAIGSNSVSLGSVRTVTTTGYSVSDFILPSTAGTGTHTMWSAPYGIGDGSTTFNIPDIRGRVVVGRDTDQVEFGAMGEQGGAKTHTLTTAQLPVHSHTGTTNTDGSHRHWVSSASRDDANFSTTNSSNTQDYGLVADAGTYSANDADKTFGRYTSFNLSNHSHAFTTNNSGSGEAHNNLQPYISLTYIIKHRFADGLPGPQGVAGPAGAAATVQAGTTATGVPGSIAAVTNAGTTSAAVFNFTIPRGDTGATGSTGPQGPSGSVTVGSTSTGVPGTNAEVTNSGTSTSAVLEFVIPRGDQGIQGIAATIEVGDVTTVTEDEPAAVTNSGTVNDAVLDFELPQGATGDSAGVQYEFSNDTADTDPTNGVLKFDSVTPASITYLYIDNVDAGAVSRTSWYDQWDVSTSLDKGQIYLGEYRSDAVAIFNVTGDVIPATGYYKVPVEFVSGTLPADEAVCYVMFSKAGDIGNETPFGGTTGQILSKASDEDYDFEWVDQELANNVDVELTEPIADGQALTYDETTGKWINATPASLLDDLTDVTLTEPLEDGQALTYDVASDSWINATPATTLDSLTDVELTEPADKQVLKYDGATDQWINAVATGGVTVSDTAPEEPFPGDAWWDSTDGNMYVYYEDEDTSQWVQVKTQAVPSDFSGVELRVDAVEADVEDLQTDVSTLQSTQILTTNTNTFTANQTFGTGGSVLNGTNGTFVARTTSSSGVPIIAQGANSQSANLQEWRDSTDNILTKVDTLGRITQGNVPAFLVQGTGTQAWSGGAAEIKVLMQGTVFTNRGSHYSTVNSRFTAPIQGVYQFHMSAAVTSNIGGPEIQVYKNGSALVVNSAIGYGASYNTFGSQVVLELNANDFVEMYIRNNNGTSFSIDRGRSFFSGYLIG